MQSWKRLLKAKIDRLMNLQLLHVKNGLMFVALDKCLHLKVQERRRVSVGVRGPVSIHTATSIDPIDITSMQITKSVNSEPGKEKGSDTMGMKHRVDFGVYVFYGSINTQLAEKTGFTNEDAEKIKASTCYFV